MDKKTNRIRLIFFIYWFLLAYIIAALVWWFIALSQLNHQMTEYKILRLHKENPLYSNQYAAILNEKHRKTSQYIGEGAIFLLLIVAGAIFLYRAVRKQLTLSQQQQNFMMAVTHELKTPIAVTKLNLETLQKRKLEEEQQQRLINNTMQEANRMNALCNNLLLSSQIEAGGYQITRETINISELLQGCLSDFMMRYPGRKFIHTTAENCFVSGDIFLLQMVMNNLIDNAIKYTPKESPVSISLRKENDKNIISIADEGPGIDDSEKKKVFQKFYRLGTETNKKSKGTGLGLYLADKIIAAHHGKISIANNQPKGAIFVIELGTMA